MKHSLERHYVPTGTARPEACNCLMFSGTIILVPILFDVLLVLANLSANAVITLAKNKFYYSNEGKNFGECLFHSNRNPSLLMAFSFMGLMNLAKFKYLGVAFLDALALKTSPLLFHVFAQLGAEGFSHFALQIST